MNVLLINLGRFGDLLQMQAAVTDLARRGNRVGLVCLENFADTAGLLDNLSYVSPLPGSRLLALLGKEASSGKAEEWHAALAALAGWKNTLFADFLPDRVCNLTPALSARLLALFLSNGTDPDGFGVDEHGFGINGSPWATFLQGASRERGVSPFNIVDMFRRVAVPYAGENSPGTADVLPLSDTARAAARARLTAEFPGPCNGFVALQLGASSEHRRWPSASFAGLGDFVFRKGGYVPLLLGSAGERPLADEYAQHAGQPFIDLCGRTTLVELAAVLAETRLLVSNDTGTLHLAAGLNIPTLGFFTATAQPFDTGPYRAGSCSIEPDLPCHPCPFGRSCPHEYVCRTTVPSAFAAQLALDFLEHGRWRMPDADAVPGGARVWESFFDTRGFLDLRSLSGHENDTRAVRLAVLRHYMRLFLDRERGRDFLPEPYPLPVPPDTDHAAFCAAAGEARKLIELFVQQGTVVQMRPIPLLQEKVLATWNRIYELLNGAPYCSALAVLWMQETQADGQNLPATIRAAQEFGMLTDSLISAFSQ